jgi:methylated-DNA-[protein]-cysteine S-methyltransferase
VIRAPFGRLAIRLEGSALAAIDFLAGHRPLVAPRSSAARQVCAQLDAYLRDPRHRFTLPLALAGSRFQRRVWRALRRIPPGRILSYAELARRLASAPRAVGGACRANPVPIVIPCHRVCAAGGRMGGFLGRRGGRAIAIKRWLLAHERGGAGPR